MWKSFNQNDEEWKKIVISQDNTSYFHDTEWSNHFSNLGWISKRWVFYKKERPITFLQGFIKKYPLGIGIIWFPDWITSDLSFSKEFQNFIKKDLNLSFIYIRFCSNREFKEHDRKLLISNKWTRPTSLFKTGLTMELSLLPQENFRSNLKRNWRRSLDKSNDSDIFIEQIYNYETICNLYDELKSLKSLNKKDLFSAAEIKSIYESFGDNIIVLGAKNSTGKVIAIRAAIIHKDCAWDIFAATGEISRMLFASHKLFVSLIEECKKRGCVRYDLSGIDPVNGNGVYNFKKGTGASEKKYLGEFEWSNNLILKKMVNLMSKYR